MQNKDYDSMQSQIQVPGHQKIHMPKKYSFTKFNTDEFEKKLIPDG